MNGITSGLNSFDAVQRRDKSNYINNRSKASFWHSNWINGQTLASLFPLLYNHSRRKQRMVRDVILGGSRIGDIAYNLDTDLRREYFQLNAI
jgi:hypothetical protein